MKGVHLQLDEVHVQLFCELLGQLGFADTGWTNEEHTGDGAAVRLRVLGESPA